MLCIGAGTIGHEGYVPPHFSLMQGKGGGHQIKKYIDTLVSESSINSILKMWTQFNVVSRPYVVSLC